MAAVAMTPPAGWNRLAPKTSSGTRERTPTCRGRTNRISDERGTHERLLWRIARHGRRKVSCATALASLTGRHVPKDLAAFHHEYHPLQRSDVAQRIAIDCDQVRLHARRE